MNKKSLISPFARASIVFSLVVLFFGCSNNSSTGPSGSTDNATVSTSTEMEQGTVTTSIFGKSAVITGHDGTTADSVVINRARIVISALKLHVVGDADDDSLHHWHDGDKDVVKAGPFIAEFMPGSAKIISTVVIPPGIYDRVKFEIHKLNENEDQSLLNDPLFGDFVNGGRYTFIIDGISYVNGVGYPFSFRSSQSENVTVFLDPPAVFDANTTYDLSLKFDPKLMFGRVGLRPLDPRDVDNKHEIEKMIHFAIKALKHKH